MTLPVSFPRYCRPLAAITAALTMLGMAPMAAVAVYTDVPVGAYYESAAQGLLEIGALDRNEVRLRPADLATRAELVKLLVNLRSQPLRYPARASFSDVVSGTWYYPYFEAAANAGWVHGDGDCYRKSYPCTARPASRVNRAEAAALLVRVFALEQTDTAPQFDDNPSYNWYYQAIQTAADHCILQGDSTTGLVRPASSMNRAEMVVMFYRASQHLQYGTDCGTSMQSGGIQSVSALSNSRVRVAFNSAVDEARAEDRSRYTIIKSANGLNVGVNSAVLINDRTVELTTSVDVDASMTYVLSVSSMRLTSGAVFSDSESFLLDAPPGHVTNVSVLAFNRIRATFDTDLDSAVAVQPSRYVLTKPSDNSSIGIQTATVVGSRTVDLTLSSDLMPGASYQLWAQNLMTTLHVSLSDYENFTYSVSTGHVTAVAVSTPIRLRVTFDADVDSTRAMEEERYTVNDGSHNIPIITASMITSRMVELLIGESLRPQRVATVTVNNMLTTQGLLFNGSGSVMYTSAGSGSLIATLNGAQEVPSVTTTATGTGSFKLDSAGLHYDITVRAMTGGSTITAAHFHLGLMGVSGPVLVPISFSGMHAVGVWTSITNDQRNALLDGKVYVNVHTVTHPDGEIRGQVMVQ